MTVTSVTERRDRRSASTPKGGIREYRRTFLVVTDTKTDGQVTVLAAAGLPTKLSPFVLTSESDSEALVIDLQPRQLSRSPFHWDVDVLYSTDVDKEEEEAAEDQDPLAVPAIIEFGFQKFRVVASSAFDILGSQASETLASIENSSGQPFDPPPMKDDNRMTLTVTRNQQDFDVQQAIDFQNAVNNDPFAGGDLEQVKVEAITASKEVFVGNGEIKFWKVSYVFAFATETWKLKLLDHGTRIVDPNDPTKWVPYVEDGVVTDVKLDGAGNALTAGDPVYLEFDIYNPMAFAELGLNELLDAANAGPLPPI